MCVLSKQKSVYVCSIKTINMSVFLCLHWGKFFATGQNILVFAADS